MYLEGNSPHQIVMIGVSVFDFLMSQTFII